MTSDFSLVSHSFLSPILWLEFGFSKITLPDYEYSQSKVLEKQGVNRLLLNDQYVISGNFSWIKVTDIAVTKRLSFFASLADGESCLHSICGHPGNAVLRGELAPDFLDYQKACIICLLKFI